MTPAPPDTPSWGSWGGNLSNWRFQPVSKADLSASDVPQLKLKWAFGIPNVKIVRSQPAAYRGRVFVGGNDGTLYSLDAATGCTVWATTISKPIRSGIAINNSAESIDDESIFFGDAGGNVYSHRFRVGQTPLGRARR